MPARTQPRWLTKKQSPLTFEDEFPPQDRSLSKHVWILSPLQNSCYLHSTQKESITSWITDHKRWVSLQKRCYPFWILFLSPDGFSTSSYTVRCLSLLQGLLATSQPFSGFIEVFNLRQFHGHSVIPAGVEPTHRCLPSLRAQVLLLVAISNHFQSATPPGTTTGLELAPGSNAMQEACWLYFCPADA